MPPADPIPQRRRLPVSEFEAFRDNCTRCPSPCALAAAFGSGPSLTGETIPVVASVWAIKAARKGLVRVILVGAEDGTRTAERGAAATTDAVLAPGTED